MYCILYDTVCQGYQPILNGTGKADVYETQEEAEAEILDDLEFYSECFVGRLEFVGHKIIFSGA